MIYITFERGDPKVLNTTTRAARLAYSRAAASVESKMATVQHKIFARIRGERETNSREF